MDETEVDEHGRPEPPLAGDEVQTLLGFLDYQRATLAWKCRGLDDDQLRVALPPTSMTLGGMLKHMALVEDSWFVTVVAEQPMPEPWASSFDDSDPDWEWHSAADDSAETLRTLWAEKVEHARAVVGGRLGHGAEALDQAHPAWGGQAQVSLRWVLVHMIEEYARHNGHADLIRESLDGETGE